MRHFLWIIMTVGLGVAGCQTQKPYQYLNVPENKAVDKFTEHGEKQRITPVYETSYGRFETFQRAGLVSDVEMNDDYIYFSVVKNVQPGLIIIERYRTKSDVKSGF